MTKAKILIVEDKKLVDPDIRNSLEKMGYDVLETALSGEAAVEKAHEVGADLILMDINLIKAIPYILKEIKLLESEDRYRDLVTHSHDLICTHDLEGRLLSVNPAAEAATGLSAEFLLQMNIREGLAPEYRDEFSIYLETIRQKGMAEGVMRVRTPGGETRFWEYRNTLRKEGVKAPIVRGMARDITEQRKMISGLRRLKQDWENIFNAIGDLVLILDPDFTVLKANRSVFSHTRHSPSELQGRKCHEIFHGSDAPPPACPMRELLKTKNQKIAPMLVETLGGSFLISCTPVFDEAGEIRQIIHIATDITSIRQTQAALQASETRFREMFENSPVGMAIVLPDGQIDMPNSAFCRMLDMEAGVLKQKSFRDITHPDDLALSNAFVQGATAGEKDSDRYEKRYIRSDGEVVWALVSAILIRDQKGEPLYFISHIVDISLQRKALEVRQQLESQLQQAQKMESVGTLAGGIAHDFNNILSSIIGYAELAEDYAEKGTALHQYLKSVLAAGDRAKDLVRQILTFARQSEVEEKPVRVKYLVNESLKLLRASIPSNIVFHGNIKSDSHILANPTQIYQVAMNLCTNAAQAMEEQGGDLFVDLKDVILNENLVEFHPGVLPGKYLLLRVRDTGPGIGPDVIEKIFDPYFTTKPKGEGTGLGLSVVKGIVERCGGFIEINSRIGQGAAFDVYFPVLEPEAKEKSEVIEKQSLPAGNERILFVDDEPTIVAIHQEMLASLGYQVSIKTDPKAALELFAADPKAFDLVISDITMPHMTGNVLAAEVLKIRPDIPVILCTGYSKRISDERAKEIGVKAFLFKPVVKIQMAETVRKVLDEAKSL